MRTSRCSRSRIVGILRAVRYAAGDVSADVTPSLAAAPPRRSKPDAELAGAAERFPHDPPGTKEAYLYRTLFARHFPQEWAARTVPGGPSVACSTAAALAWDPSLRAVVDPSGRAVRAVHQAAY